MQTLLGIKWKLKACRVQAGYTQREVADKLGVTEASVINWETGKGAPSMENGLALTKLYDIPMEAMDFTKEGNAKSGR